MAVDWKELATICCVIDAALSFLIVGVGIPTSVESRGGVKMAVILGIDADEYCAFTRHEGRPCSTTFAKGLTNIIFVFLSLECVCGMVACRGCIVKKYSYCIPWFIWKGVSLIWQIVGVMFYLVTEEHYSISVIFPAFCSIVVTVYAIYAVRRGVKELSEDGRVTLDFGIPLRGGVGFSFHSTRGAVEDPRSATGAKEEPSRVAVAEEGPSRAAATEEGSSSASGAEKGPFSASGAEKGPSSDSGVEEGPSSASGAEKDPSSDSGAEEGPSSASGAEEGPSSAAGAEEPHSGYTEGVQPVTHFFKDVEES